MSSSYSSLDWVLSHWAHFTVHRFICVYLCVIVCFCFILHGCCIIVSTVGWTWWDWSLILRTCLPSVLWHCWLGHLTHTNPSPMWPIMCFVGTLNLAQSVTCLTVQMSVTCWQLAMLTWSVWDGLVVLCAYVMADTHCSCYWTIAVCVCGTALLSAVLCTSHSYCSLITGSSPVAGCYHCLPACLPVSLSVITSLIVIITFLSCCLVKTSQTVMWRSARWIMWLIVSRVDPSVVDTTVVWLCIICKLVLKLIIITKSYLLFSLFKLCICVYQFKLVSALPGLAWLTISKSVKCDKLLGEFTVETLHHVLASWPVRCLASHGLCAGAELSVYGGGGGQIPLHPPLCMCLAEALAHTYWLNWSVDTSLRLSVCLLVCLSLCLCLCLSALLYVNVTA